MSLDKILLSSENTSDHEESVETIILDTLGTDINPEALNSLKNNICNRSPEQQSGAILFTTKDAGYLMSETFRIKTEAHLTDQSNQVDICSDIITVLSSIAGIKQLDNVKHIATLEEAEAVLSNPEKTAAESIENLKNSKYPNSIYNGTPDEISYAMVNDINTDMLEPDDRKNLITTISSGVKNALGIHPSHQSTVFTTEHIQKMKNGIEEEFKGPPPPSQTSHAILHECLNNKLSGKTLSPQTSSTMDPAR